MVENIAQGKYCEAVDSYTALNLSSKIRGELVEKDDKNIKIDIGNGKALEIELREDISIEKGETVLIDRNNIARSKVINLDESIKFKSGEVEIYNETLKKLDIDVNKENIKIIKQLDSYGIDITEENFETYKLAKDSLENISNSLDYESTIRLIEMDVDVENESVEKLATLVGELEEEKEGFNILKLFKKKELTTEDAEEIAEKLYGIKMGKDITDIIKSLYKKEVNITKRNIEKINDVFYKLDNLKDIEDKTFINTIKNKLDVNIDNLYRVKRYVKDDVVNGGREDIVEIESKINITNNRIINIKSYEKPNLDNQKITNKDLRLLEEDIEDLMLDLDLEISDENIKLSKEFIKRNMDVTKENITSVDEMKKALVVIVKNLDKETAAQLAEKNIDVATEDIRVLAKEVELLKGLGKESEIASLDAEVSGIGSEKVARIDNKVIERSLSEDENIVSAVRDENLKTEEVKELRQGISKVIEILDKDVEEIKLDKTIDLDVKKEKYNKKIEVLKQDIVKLIENIEDWIEKPNIPEGVDTEIDKDLYTQEIKELKQEVAEVIEKTVSIREQEVSKIREYSEKDIREVNINESEDLEIKNQDNIEELIKKVELLDKIEEKDILTLLEKNIDFKIDKIEQAIFKKRTPTPINKIEDATYISPRNNQRITEETIIKDTLGSITKISTAFNDLGKLDFNIVAFQLRRNIPMTIMNMQKSNKILKENNNHENIKVDHNQGNSKDVTVNVKQALIRNGLEISRLNIQKTMEAYRSYNNIKENLTSTMVKQAVTENKQIENMDIKNVSKYVDEYRKTELNYQTTQKFPSNTKRYAEQFTDSVSEIIKNSDDNLMFLIKNKKPLSFRQLKEINSMFKNEDQIGHKISEIENLVDKDGDSEIKEKFENLRKDIMDISKSMKGSKNEVEESYRRLEKSIKDIEENIKLVSQDENSLMRKKSKEVLEKIDESKVIAKDNKIIQFPLYMNGQFTNLNMYFRDKQREESKKNSEDISVVLSINTVNMGNLNINLDIEKKNINIKIGLENMDDKTYIESRKEALIELLKEGGYVLGEVSFLASEEIDILGVEEATDTRATISDGNLDIKV